MSLLRLVLQFYYHVHVAAIAHVGHPMFRVLVPEMDCANLESFGAAGAIDELGLESSGNGDDGHVPVIVMVPLT